MLDLHREWKAVIIAITAALWLWPATTAQAVIPSDALLQRLNPQNNVRTYDVAGILRPDQKNAIEGILQGMEQQTGAQGAVVVVDSLEGGQIDDFANKLFRKWGIGQKDKNNGILLLVALKDRKARIEVGYGLEPILPDALAGRILDEQLFPAFRAGNYANGLTQTARRIAEIVTRNELAPPASIGSTVRTAGNGINSAMGQFGATVFFGLFVLIGSFMLGGGIGSLNSTSIMFGLMFGGIPLGMAFASTGLLPRIILCSMAAIMGCVGLVKGIRNPQAFKWTTTSGRSGWSSGGGFSSGGGGGGFGGGSSGGGGASGGW